MRVTRFGWIVVGAVFAWMGVAGATPIAKGFEPNPMEWKGMTAETAVDGATLGLQGCQGFFSAQPVATIEASETLVSAFVLTLDAQPANRVLLGIRFSDGSSICAKSDKNEPGPAIARFKELTKGKTELFVGHLMKGVKIAHSIKLQELGRTAQGSLSKSSTNPAVFPHLTGRTAVDPQKLGHPGGNGCSAEFPENPILALEVTEAIESDVQFSLLNLPGGSLLVRSADGNVDCYESITTGSPKLVRKGLPVGRVEVFAGFNQNGYYFDVDLQVEDLGRTKATQAAAFAASPTGKKAEFCGTDPKKLKERFAGAKLPTALVANIVCVDNYSWSAAVQRGVQSAVDAGETNPLQAATLVASCRALGPEAYYGWRQCKREAARTDEAKTSAAVDEALTGLPGAAGAKELYLAAVRAGAEHIASLDKAMADHEKGYPNEKALFDDVSKMVETKYRPAFKQFGPALAEIDAWRVEVDKGPGFAQGCEEKWSKEIQAYVAKSMKKASGDLLAETLWSPVGHRMVQALAYCQNALGKGREKIHGVHEMLPGGEAFGGTYEMEVELLGEKSYVRKEYASMPMSNWTRSMEVRADDEGSMTRRLGGPWYASSRYRFTGGDVVATVTPKGENATITFKHASRKDVDYYDCVEGKITQIDEHGYIHREQHCKERPITVDETPPPIVVPKSEVAKIAPGSQIDVSSEALRDKGPRSGHVQWVKRGNDLVWVMGVSAP